MDNWTKIIKEAEPYLDRKFKDAVGNTYRLFGVVHGSDDYYYGVSNLTTGTMELWSCVGDLEAYFNIYDGYEWIDNERS